MERQKNKPRVGVIGLAGQSAFMAAESFPAPGETVSCRELFFELGGKGYNQAIACARMGVETVFVGAVGADSDGEACRKELEQEGIIPCLVEKDVHTAYAVITTRADGENTVAVFNGAAKCLTGEDLRTDSVYRELQKCDYFLLQNELSAECLQAAFALARELGIPVIFNPAPAGGIPRELLAVSALVSPNLGEAKQLLGCPPEEELTDKKLQHMLETCGIHRAVVTMGGKGALLIEDGASVMVPAASCGPVTDTTGAGDTFSGTLAGALALGKTLEQAARIAAVAAGISVTKPGAAGSIPTAEERETYLRKNNL